MIVPDILSLSPNYNQYANGTPVPMPFTAKTVIIHSTRSGHSMNPTEFQGTLNYMKVPGTDSSHWVISRTGTKARVVADDRQAWHAQEDNDNAWGIELEQGIETDGFTPEQIQALVEVCRDYRDNYGVPARHSTNSIEGGFIGHQETAQGIRNGKSDPGSLFPWTEFIADLQPVVATPDGIGVVLDDGTDVGNVYAPPPGRTIAGIGIHLTDGSIQGLWPAPAATKVHQIDAFTDGSVKVT